MPLLAMFKAIIEQFDTFNSDGDDVLDEDELAAAFESLSDEFPTISETEFFAVVDGLSGGSRRLSSAMIGPFVYSLDAPCIPDETVPMVIACASNMVM